MDYSILLCHLLSFFVLITCKIDLVNDMIGLYSMKFVIISEGKTKVRELPEHGEYKIVTHQGKVKRMRREEGEEF